jgi:tetratricopeptide (TPR) repeat protein
VENAVFSFNSAFCWLDVKHRDASTPAIRPVFAVLLILGAVLLAWSNSFTAPFEFDDNGSILGNPTIQHLVPPVWMRPPAAGETVSGRPVLNLSLALNYAMGGLDVRGYHAANLAIHLFAALTLFGIVRRTLALRSWSALGGDETRRTGFATAVALLWAVHPLQVESVTYVVQRAESLAGLLCLLTLYCFVRGMQAGKGWFALAFLACLLGVGTKETAVVMPAILLLYDWVFGAGTWRGVWRARRGAHAALLLTWLPLAVGVGGGGGPGGGAFAFTPAGFGHYWVAQLKAVTCYLGLVVWPSPLVFDRAFFRIEHFAAAAPYAIVVLGLLGATVWALRRRTPAGFLGATFFILLSPTSLMPGLLQVIVEHRMYLALAAPLILLVTLAWRWAPRYAALLVAVAAVALGLTTLARNRVYQSQLSLWQDTVRKSPDNPRAHYNLGLALRAAGQEQEAAAEFERTLALQPNHGFAFFELGKGELLASRWTEAARYFDAAVQADPHFVAARVNLGRALTELGRTAEALAQYEAALADEPGAPDIRTNQAALLIQVGRVGEGSAILREVLANSPELAEAHYHLGLALTKSGAAADAEAEFRTAVQQKPTFGAAQRALGNAQAARGDTVAAEASYREALRLDDRSAESWFALGGLLARQERVAQAATAFEAALARDPTHVLARANLANCQLMTGQLDAAIANYEAVLRVRPGDAGVQRNLEMARAMKRTGGK